MGVGTLGVISWAEQAHTAAIAHTMGVVTFSLYTLFFSIATKDERTNGVHPGHPLRQDLHISTGISVLTLILATVLGPLQAFLDHQPRPPAMAHLHRSRCRSWSSPRSGKRSGGGPPPRPFWPGTGALASGSRVLTMDLRERIASLMGRAHSDLAELVAIRSVADARQFPPEVCARAAGWVRDRFAELGFVDLELAETADGSRAVVGSRPAPDPGAPTVLLYAHYDVQPPLDEQAWRSPPFALTQRDGRWYGRGAADCKGNIVMHLTALRALGDDIPVNLKLVVEGSEEQGTSGLEDYVPGHADQLRADAILVCDTGNAAVGVARASRSACAG